MKAVSIGYGAYKLVSRNPDDKLEFDFLNGKMIIDNTDKKFIINDIIKVEKFKIDRYKVTRFHLFRESETEISGHIKFIALKHGDDSWTFICDSQESYYELAKEFDDAFPTYKWVKRESGDSYEKNNGRLYFTSEHFYNDALKGFDCKRELLKFLLDEGTKNTDHLYDPYGKNSEAFNKWGEKLDPPKCDIEKFCCPLPEDIIYFPHKVRYCIIIEDSFDVIYNELKMLLPEQIEKTKKQSSIEKRIREIKDIYGDDLQYVDKVLSDYSSQSHKDLLKEKDKLEHEISIWKRYYDDEMIDTNFFNTYAETINRKIKIVVEKIKKPVTDIYGEDFCYTDSVLSAYSSSLPTDLVSEKNKLEKEIVKWEKYGNDGTIDNKFCNTYIEIIKRQLKIVEDGFDAELKCSILNQLRNYDFSYTKSSECRTKFIDNLLDWKTSPNIDSAHTIELYNKYCMNRRKLMDLVNTADIDYDSLGISEYVNFYHFGSVLLCDYLSQINSNKYDKPDKKEVDSAMMYFYETDSLEKAYSIDNEKKRLKSRKKGEFGETEVEYALKWLGKDYIAIPKKQSSKFQYSEVLTIELSNPSFIDESQEYDHIVVGKQGVFVIETKSVSGTLRIDSGKNWIRTKQDGTMEGIKNPIQQVDRHTDLLKSFLSKNIPVIGLICIANDKTIIEGVENSLVPIVKSDLLCRFIRDYPCEITPLSVNDIQECVSLIEEHRCIQYTKS